MPTKENIVFVKLPTDIARNYPHLYEFIQPDIPLPIEASTEAWKLNTETLTEEMFLSGILHLLAKNAEHEYADYYRRFMLKVRPNIINELASASLSKADEGCFELALEIIDALIGLSPENEGIYAFKTSILEKQKKKLVHVELFENFGQEDVVFKTDYAAVYNDILNDRDEEALLKIRRFIEREPQMWQMWFLLGWALRKLKRWENGAAAFRKAIELGGGNKDTRNELAICLMEIGELKQARRELEKALFEDPENIKIISNLGILALKSGNYREASGFFRVALEIDPHDKIAMKYLEKITDNDIESS
ncbi:MAG: tetratricopeptide repeat protein [Treponema sp.]|jgi:Flp pilus assembly protein TadD|nr:tetratricopeptide repeat protein [Treponema sp.]